MKKTFALAAVAALALASCDAPLQRRPAAPSAEAAPAAKEIRVAKSGDEVSVTYTGTLADGKIFDASSLHGGAPFSFTLGAGGAIQGFDDAVTGMKVGETKTVVIPPEKAYGAKTDLQAVPMEFFKEKPTEQTVPRKAFAETITEEAPVASLPAGKGFVGATIDMQDGGVATVTALSGGVATVTFPNSANPFAGKKIAKGTKGPMSIATTVEIVAVKGDQVTIRTYNPFYGKALKAGLSADMGKYGVVKVASVDKTGAVLEIPNAAKLAGETLTFQLTLTEIK